MVVESMEILEQVKNGTFRRNLSGGNLRDSRPQCDVLSTIHDNLLASLHVSKNTDVIDWLTDAVSFKRMNKKVNGTF